MSAPGRRTSRSGSDVFASEATPPKLQKRTPGGTPGILSPQQEGAERVKVVVRIRPPHNHETGGGLTIADDDRTITLQRRNPNVAQTDFAFDKILGTEATQEDVYEAAVRPIVEDVLKGYNGTIMAYGQTGAGKTYTLSSVSSAENIGMMPRAASNLFNEIAADSSHVYNVVMSYVQIYMELIQDLLKPANENLQIREGSNGVFVSGVEEQPVGSMHDCLRLMQLGDRNRTTAFTQLNAHSSRSHAIIMLTIVKRRRNGSKDTTPDEEKMKVGKLFIVDLAGSERLKKSQSTGIRASEAKAINQSLTTLGICINSRADRNSKHTPFRDSKLTRLLQESLGGNAKTSLVIAAANAVEHCDETLQSLQFGSRAMHVQTKAIVNESLGSKLLNADLLAKLANLEVNPCLVDASLLAKEEELEKIQEALQGERERAQQMIADMRAQQENEQALKEQELSAAQAQLMARQQEAEQQGSRLKEAAEKVSLLEDKHRQQLQRMQDKVDRAQQELIGMADNMALVEEQKQEAVNQAKEQAAREMDALKSNLGSEKDKANQELQLALEEANTSIHILTKQSNEALERQQQAYDQKLSQVGGMHQQALEALERKLKAQVQALQQKEGTISELSQQLESQQQETQLLLETLTQEHESELGDLTQKHKTDSEALKQQLEEVQQQSREREDSLTKLHEDEIWTLGSRHKDEVKRMVAQMGCLKTEKDKALEENSAQYCQQLTSVALDHQKAVDKYHTQLRTLESESQQAQEGLRAEHNRELQEIEKQNAANLSEAQAQIASLKAGKQALLEEFEQRTKNWRTERDNREAVWKKKLEAAEEAAAEHLGEAMQALEAQKRNSIYERELSAAALADLQEQFEDLHRQHSELADVHSSSASEIRALQEALSQADRQLSNSQRQASHAGKRLRALESRDEQLQSLWASNKRMTWAARVIQRAYKTWRMRALQFENLSDKRALLAAQSTHTKLEGSYMQMEQSQHQQNVWTGHQMVAGSLQQLEETIQLVRTAFLLPSKELKQYSNLKSRMSLSPAGSGSLKGSYSPSLLGRNLSFASQSSQQSFISKAGLQEGPLGAGTPSAMKLGRQPVYGNTGASNIQAHWGTPTR